MDFDQKLAKIIDYAMLKPQASIEEIMKACQEAKTFGFACICVNPCYVSLAAKLLKNTGVKVCGVVGFPFGASTSTVKAIEAHNAIIDGAEEIDMVINIGALKSNEDTILEEEIRMVRTATLGYVLKVILETGYLTNEEKIRACQIAQKLGANFIKTSTGFNTTGATVEDVKLIREIVGIEMGVKASGGIRTVEEAYKLIEAGATRIGTSQAVAIVSGGRKER